MEFTPVSKSSVIFVPDKTSQFVWDKQVAYALYIDSVSVKCKEALATHYCFFEYNMLFVL